MKSKFKDKFDTLSNNMSKMDIASMALSTVDAISYQRNEKEEKPKASKKDQKQMDLLNRLATGAKVNIDKKAMKKLTNKNYEKLPEIRKQKEDAKKQEELAKKKQRAIEYQKELDMRLR